MRRDLRPMRVDDELVVELRMLTARRADLAADRTRAVNRLRDQLLGVFPALERALDLTCQGPLILVAGEFSLAALRLLGCEGLTAWLRERKVRCAAALAAKAVAAAEAQHIRLPGEQMATVSAVGLAREVLDLGQRIKATFADQCTGCPLRQRCTKAKAGRIVTIRPNHDQQAATRHRAATDADWQSAYRRWRPPVERVIAWITAGGNRRLRYRGAIKNDAWLNTRAAALNLRTLINLGLHPTDQGWALAQA